MVETNLRWLKEKNGEGYSEIKRIFEVGNRRNGEEIRDVLEKMKALFSEKTFQREAAEAEQALLRGILFQQTHQKETGKPFFIVFNTFGRKFSEPMSRIGRKELAEGRELLFRASKGQQEQFYRERLRKAAAGRLESLSVQGDSRTKGVSNRERVYSENHDNNAAEPTMFLGGFDAHLARSFGGWAELVIQVQRRRNFFRRSRAEENRSIRGAEKSKILQGKTVFLKRPIEEGDSGKATLPSNISKQLSDREFVSQKNLFSKYIFQIFDLNPAGRDGVVRSFLNQNEKEDRMLKRNIRSQAKSLRTRGERNRRQQYISFNQSQRQAEPLYLPWNQWIFREDGALTTARTPLNRRQSTEVHSVERQDIRDEGRLQNPERMRGKNRFSKLEERQGRADAVRSFSEMFQSRSFQSQQGQSLIFQQASKDLPEGRRQKIASSAWESALTGERQETMPLIEGGALTLWRNSQRREPERGAFEREKGSSEISRLLQNQQIQNQLKRLENWRGMQAKEVLTGVWNALNRIQSTKARSIGRQDSRAEGRLQNPERMRGKNRFSKLEERQGRADAVRSFSEMFQSRSFQSQQGQSLLFQQASKDLPEGRRQK